MITRLIIRGYRIFHNLDIRPHERMNIIIGDNEAGKSSLLEALTLVLTGRLNGRWAQEELNPHWFNDYLTKEFFSSLDSDSPEDPPSIMIEAYLDDADDALQGLRGVHNSQTLDVPGLKLSVAPSQDYTAELEEYLHAPDRPSILPVEYYRVEWRDFADQTLTRRPKGLGHAFIDSRTIRASTGVDYHTRQLLNEFIEPKERAEISLAHRRARQEITESLLSPPNDRIAKQEKSLHDQELRLQVDQSSRGAWESSVIPQVAGIPFALAGQGQQAAIKIALAMANRSEETSYVLVEEPENHLSHTSLSKLPARIDALAGERQIFLTTHSSFVLNRLGLDRLLLLNHGRPAAFADVPDDTVRYFQRLSGYDTLRLVLAEKVVLVEGPSDEIIFQRFFMDLHDGSTPADLGIDVISMRGVALERSLQLCDALDRQVVALRDNDGEEPSRWQDRFAQYLKTGTRELCVGEPELGRTLEPQLVTANSEQTLRTALSLKEGTELQSWMANNKTESAMRLLDAHVRLKCPPYIQEAINLLQ